jgi:REP element-mobilizing transposase RayT
MNDWEGRSPGRPLVKSSKKDIGDLEVAAPSQVTPRFFDEQDEVSQQKNRLPHWHQDGRTYFVTFHLADSIPRSKLNDWTAEKDAWQKWNPQPWSAEQQQEYVRRFANTAERWLDAGEGSCVLSDPRVAAIVGEAFQHFQGTRCQHYAWVVMLNHVHLLFSIRPGQDLPDVLRNWKGYTSRTINRLLARSGSLWQKDYFDRLVRNSEHFWNCAKYIRNNPRKARLSPGGYLLYESDFVQDGLNREGRLPSRPTKKNLNIGGLEAAAPSYD